MSIRAGAPDAPTGSRAPASWRHHVPGAVVLTIGIALSAAAFGLVRSRARQAQQAAFERRASLAAHALQTSLDLSLEDLRTLPSLFEASSEVTRQEFRAFVRDGLTRHSSIFAFIWAKRVFAAERPAFERAARAEGYPDFQITESDEQRRMVRAPDRAEYLPCLYIEPPIPLSFGYDEASEIRRATTAGRARDSGLAVVSPRLRLIIDNPNVASVIVFVPVYGSGRTPTTVDERRQTLRGFGVELFRVAPLIERLQKTDDFAGMAMGLLDATDGNDEAVLYETEAGVAHARAPAPHALLSRATFPFAGRTWALVASSPMPSPPGSGIVLTAGVLLSVLLAGIVTALNTIIRLRRRIGAALKLGPYTLEEKLGEGGMGVVYRATHAMLRRPAAIKLLLKDRTGERDLARFEREVQLTSRLAHPNTISIFDYGRTADGVFYYVMEYIDGFDLERLVDEDGPLQPARVIRILAQASGALSEAHALGLIHRDIKPANIVLTERVDEPDIVKVVDFGLVKTLETSPGDASLTNVDAITGTPLYLAPEAIASPDSVDARSDLYALGAVGYFLITGQHVFDAATVVEVCSKHLLEAPVPPSQRLGRAVPPDLEALILACLAKRREDRPASAQAMHAALLACADAGKYDVAAARVWWTDRGATLRARSKAKRAGAHAATMAIDLRGRGAGDHG
ncbi:MAG TPA: CHASE domain-containing protein [Polyangiaceae bacterium]|nr:CHASE domain-containing protein [Polyangiaceae bacterium]